MSFSRVIPLIGRSLADSSANASSPLPASFLPPPGTNWLQTVHITVTLLVVGCIGASLLISVMILLTMFSTPELRRRPVYWMNMTAIWVGLLLASLTFYIDGLTLLSPSTPIQVSFFLTYGFFSDVAPILVDCILLLRLIAVFPRKTNSQVKLAAVIALPIILKTGRFIMAPIVLAREAQLAAVDVHVLEGDILQIMAPYCKAAWLMAAIDNTYCSSIFLYQIHRFMHSTGSSNIRRTTPTLSGFFYIAVTNFIFPTLLSITQIIVFIAGMESTNVMVVEQVNLYITIIGVVFATVWTSGAQAYGTGGLVPTSMAITTGSIGFAQGSADPGRGQTATTMTTGGWMVAPTYNVALLETTELASRSVSRSGHAEMKLGLGRLDEKVLVMRPIHVTREEETFDDT